MKKVLHKLTGLLAKKTDKEAKDPFYDFIVHGRSADKKRVYNRALEGADADQHKILDEYQKKLELRSLS
jgi:hypothetical protein